jgi:response regulator RpfG family c-di-GMP phosphodiesterase
MSDLAALRMNEKILLVDDEVNLLAGLQRVLRQEFTVEVAAGGMAALEMIESHGPYAVVVSDMRMPGIDGVHLLRAVRERSPDSVRLMLTGNTDLKTAIDAVNEGAIFRFLTKPCPEDVFRNAMRAALQQARLINAERDLLEKTLHGSVKALTEILSLVNPAAFSRASRVHRTVKHIVDQMKLPDGWSYELAAMLSQIGCVALDPDTVEAVYCGATLPAVEEERFKMHPGIAYEFLRNIPRLETVALMIAGQQGASAPKPPKLPTVGAESARIGAEIIHVAVDFDQLCLSGVSRSGAVAELKSRKGYNPRVVDALEKIPHQPVNYIYQEISIREMTVGMILDEDLRAPNGMLLVARDQEISYPLMVRIRNYSQKTPINNRIRVKTVQPYAPGVKEFGNLHHVSIS